MLRKISIYFLWTYKKLCRERRTIYVLSDILRYTQTMTSYFFYIMFFLYFRKLYIRNRNIGKRVSPPTIEGITRAKSLNSLVSASEDHKVSIEKESIVLRLEICFDLPCKNWDNCSHQNNWIGVARLNQNLCWQWRWVSMFTGERYL